MRASIKYELDKALKRDPTAMCDPECLVRPKTATIDKTTEIYRIEFN